MNRSAVFPPPAMSGTAQGRRWRAAVAANGTRVALATVVLAALTLRLFGLNWDDGRDLHPDELYVAKDVLIQRIFMHWPPDWANLLDPDHSGLNPRSVNPDTGEPREYPYGALPLLVTDTVATLLGGVTGRPWTAPDHAYLVGRALSALLDTLTVVLVFAIAAQLATPGIALMAAFFAAAAPMSIQLAHFFTTDSWLTFFVSLALFAAIRAADTGAPRWFAATGGAFGLALAAKGSVFALAGLIGAALVYRAIIDYRATGAIGEALFPLPRQAAVAGGTALVCFALFEPYVLVRPAIFVQSLRTQAEIVSGSFDIPFTRIFVGTAPGLYQIEQFVRWGFGPAAGLLSLLGIVLLARALRSQPTAASWILVCWLIGYGVVILLAETKFLRYLAPLVPVLAVTAGLALGWLGGLVRRRLGARWSVALTAALLLATAAWTFAFTSIYATEHPRLTASRWIYANVPPGSRLSWEYWDDRLPKPLGPALSESEFQYQFDAIDLYRDVPPAELADQLFEKLRRVDYIVTSSDRINAAVPRSPWRYAVQATFNRRLQAGTLGFAPVAEFHVTPRLGPWQFDDRAADESFINYDHPRVTIFQRIAPIDRAAFDQQMAWAVNQPWQPARYPTSPTLRLDQPVGDLPVLDDFQWSAPLTQHSPAAIVAWLVLLGVLQIAGRPLVAALLPGFADAGWGLARLVTIVLAGYAVWLVASLRLAPFHAVTAWGGVALVALTGWWLWRRLPRAGDRLSHRFALGAELVFWGVFGFFLLLRFVNPDSWHPIWGGEKPMEFAHLNATLRSASFPPYDPWFADGILNYYYYGLYLVAFLLKLTGIPTAIAFNLAQPTFIALLASAGFSVAATVARDVTRRRLAGFAGGIAAVLLLVGVGNLSTLGRLLSNEQHDFSSFADWTWDGSRAIRAGITEFPFFTGLYADLHAHVVALPISVLVIGLVYTVTRDAPALLTAAPPLDRRSARCRLVGLGLVLAITLGTLLPTNTWDVPVYAALTLAGCLMAGWTRPAWRFRLGWLAAGLGLLALAYLLFKPFHDHYVALFSSVARVAAPTPVTEAATHIGALVVISFVGLVLALLAQSRQIAWPLSQPALVLGGLALVLLLANLRARIDPAASPVLYVAVLALAAGVAGAALWLPFGRRERERGFAVLLGREGATIMLIAGVIAAALGQLVLGGWLLMLGLGFGVWTSGASLASRFTAVLVMAAAGVGAGTELIFVVDDLVTIAPRMNTIFKFYNQVWVLLAVAGGVWLAVMLSGAGWLSTPRRFAADRSAAIAQGWARGGVLIAAVLIAGSLLYPVFAIAPRLAQRFPVTPGPTLDGLAWMRTATMPWQGSGGGGELRFADDLAAIEWLNANVAGSPVIAEASIGPYRCNGSRFAIATGLPTILGWDRHERQQRPPAELGPRLADVETLYASPAPREKRAILDKYSVAYVVVGPLERYGIHPGPSGCEGSDNSEGIAAFDTMVGRDLGIAFQEGETTVYRVLPVAAVGPAA